MHIRNKFLRLIVSIFITLLLYFLLSLALTQSPTDSVLETMILLAAFGLFLVMPTLIFMVYIIYQILTKKNNRSKKIGIIVKRMIVFVIVMGLLYAAAIHTDLFG